MKTGKSKGMCDSLKRKRSFAKWGLGLRSSDFPKLALTLLLSPPTFHLCSLDYTNCSFEIIASEVT